MSEFKIIRVDKLGVRVQAETFNACDKCKHLEEDLDICYTNECAYSRYLTEQEEQGYYSSQRV